MLDVESDVDALLRALADEPLSARERGVLNRVKARIDRLRLRAEQPSGPLEAPLEGDGPPEKQ